MVETATNVLENFFKRNDEAGGRRVRKYANYLQIYAQLFQRFRLRRPVILEIGVQHGGSLLMWNEYFGGKVDIIGVDVLPGCKKFERDNVRIFIGDQSDPQFLKKLSKAIGTVDLIIDDGSHVPLHQIMTFEILFYNNLSEGGMYFVEDCHTSYWPSFGGGVRRKSSFIEYAKRICDDINAWHAQNKALPITPATKWIKIVIFASSLVVFEKAAMSAPPSLSSGSEEIDLDNTFGRDRFGIVLRFLRRSSTLEAMVRQNQFLWQLMRRLMTRPRGPKP